MIYRRNLVSVKRVALKIGSGKTPRGGAETYVPEGVVFIRSQNVHFDGLRLDDVVFINPAVDEEMRSSRVRPNDILLNITGASLGRVAIAPESLGAANVNQHVCIIRPSHKVVPRFLLWCLQSHPVQERILELQAGGNRDGLTFEQVGDFMIPELPLPEQAAISDMLDRETARINALIDAKERMKALLVERRDAELQGFADPRHDPDEKMLPVRRILRKEERPALASDVVTAFRDGRVMARHRRRIEGFTESEAQAGYQGVEAGDLVFHGLDGFAGAIGVSEDRGVCSPVYHVCSARDGFNTGHVALALRALALTGYLGLQSGNVRERAVDFRNWDTLARVPIPVPPLQRQQARAEQFLRRRDWTDLVVARLEEQVALLSEHRRTLVTAAVSGQIEASVAA